MIDEIKIPEEFADICPFNDSEFHANMATLVKEPLFKHAVTYALPDIDYDNFINQLLSINTKDDFQKVIMKPFLEMLVQKTTDGLTWNGVSNFEKDKYYTCISNHRDIVLDASFLNLCLLYTDVPTTEIAIGNNLLIFDWISVLVRLNKSFIVKRDLTNRQFLEAAQQLSNYIHFAINEKHQSVWIAQRQGRAKDSNDRTQESLIKMLAIGGKEKSIIERLKEINLMPVSISYEYDPNDYLKATEFLMKKKDPDFKKSQRDDLFSMETGLLKYKGRVHFEFTKCINPLLDELPDDLERAEATSVIANIIDKQIHLAYHLYPCNYIAYDMLYKKAEFTHKYMEEDKAHYMQYVENQLSKVEVEYNEEDKEFMREMIYTMYSNPVLNQLKALGVHDS